MVRPSWLRRFFAPQPKKISPRRPSSRVESRVELLEDRLAPATITGSTGPGGFEATTGTSSLALWFDPGALNLTDGAPVASWSNSSAATGAGAAGVQATVGLQPTFESDTASLINSNPVVRFDGVNDFLQGAVTAAASKTFYLVSKSTGIPNGCCSGGIYTQTGGAGNSNGLEVIAAGGGVRMFVDFPGAGFNGTSEALNVTNVASATYTTTGAALAVNGTTEMANALNWAATGTLFQLGTRNNELSRFFKGDMAEAVMFNRVLTSAEQQIVNSALGAKYGVATINNDHYTGDTPANNNYDFGVFGIGRTGAGSEVLSAGQAGFGLETSSLSDGVFVMAGHSGAANFLSNQDLPGGVTSRWNRSWFVDKTGTTTSTTLAFDFTDSGQAAPGGSPTYTLLYRASLASPFTTVAASPTVVGDTVTFSIADAALVNGYYTLGASLPPDIPSITANTGPGGVGLTQSVSSTDLVLWLKSDTITGVADGANVTTWNNSVSSVNKAGNASVVNTAPTLESAAGDLKNGNPVVSFSGQAGATTGDVMSGTGTFTANKTMFLVGQQRTVSPTSNCCQGGISTGVDANGLVPNGATGNWTTDWPGAGAPVGSPNQLGSWSVVSGAYDSGTTFTGTRLWVNGDGSFSNSGTPQGLAASDYRLGARQNSGDSLGRFFDGNLGEAVIYNSVLNNAQRILVENSLSAKWDIAMTANDLYAGDTGASGDYDLDVFGIGRTAAGSESLAAGQAGFGIGTLALNDGAFLIAGHNSPFNSLTGSDVPGGVTTRWSRSWYVQKTGTTTTTQLSFDFTDSGLVAPSGSPTYSLLYRASAASPFSVVAGATVAVTGDTVKFTLGDGSLLTGYYTLGSTIPVPAIATIVTGGTGPGGVGTVATASSTGLELWLKSETITGVADGSNITTWNNSVTRAGAAGPASVVNTAPTHENAAGDLKNGLPVVSFSGVASASVGDVISGTGTFTANKSIFLVAQQRTVAPASCCQGGISTGSDANGVGPTGNTYFTDWAGAGANPGSPNKLGAWGVMSGLYDNGTLFTGTRLWVDGAGFYTNSAVARGAAASDYRLGARQNTGDGLGRFFDGNIGEAVVFNSVLNDAQRTVIENALGAKWDIALTAADYYDGDTAGKGHYDLDVFGIGTLDAANQLLSGGAAGFGLSAVGGLSPTGTAFVLAGRKAAAATITTSNLPSGVDQRWNPVLYLDKTGGVDAALSFDFSDAGLGAIPATTIGYRLLYAPTNAFESSSAAFTQVNATAIVNGDTITFSLPNGQLLDGYYTLGLLDSTATLQADAASAGNGAADTFRIVRSGANVDMFVNGVLVRSSPQASLTGINVIGSTDTDTFTVDGTGGNPAPIGGVTYNGGSGAGSDSLALTGGSATTIAYSFINNSDGSVAIDGRVVTYTGLEPITDNMVVANRSFTFTGGVETIAITDAGGGQTRIDSTLGEFVNFTAPSTSLSVITNGGDTVNITAFAPGFATPLITFQDTTSATAVNQTAANTLPDASSLSLVGSVTLNLAGSDTIGSLAGSGNVVIAGGQTLSTGNDNTNTTFSGNISGAGALTKIGSGIFTLSGTNTYAGVTTVSAGTLRNGVTAPPTYQAYQTAISGSNQAYGGSLGYDFTVNPGKTVVVTQVGFWDANFDGLAISHVVKISAFGGGTDFVVATVPAGTAAPLQSGYRFVTLASPVTLAPGNYTIYGDAYNVDANYNSGGGVVGPTDAGPTTELTFFGGSRFGSSAGVYPTNGDGGPAYRYGAASFQFATTPLGVPFAPTSTITLTNSGATLDLNGNNTTIGSLTGVAGSSVTLGAGNLAVGNASSTVFSGSISGSGALIKQGSGTLSLAGANSQGSTTISAGVLQIGNGGATGTPGNGTITNNASLVFNRSDAGLNVANVIAGTGTVTQLGSGTTTLSAANTYSGDTTITAGTLRAGNAAAIPSGAGKGNVVDNATLDLGGFSITINGLTGTGFVDNSAAGGPFTLSAGGNNQTSTFSGTIRNTTGTVALNKVGSGVLTLAGGNTYSGATTVTAGTLRVGTVAPPPSYQPYQITTNTVTNQGGGFSLGYDFNVNAGKTVIVTQLGFYDSDLDGLANSHVVKISTQGTGATDFITAVIPAGTATTLASGYRFVTLPTPIVLAPGNYTIWGDDYSVDKNYNTGGGGPAGPTDAGPTGELTFVGNSRYGIPPNTFPTNIDGGPAYRYGAVSFLFNVVPAATPIPVGSPVSLVSSGATLDLAGNNTTLASLAGVAGSAVTLGAGNLAVGNATSTDFGGSISGSGGLFKQGSGTLTLSGTNSHGPTTINAGALQIGNGGSGGTLGSGPVTTNTSLIFNRGDAALNVGVVISGPGTVTQAGSGTTTLSAANTYSGNTILSAGVLRAGNIAAIPSGPGRGNVVDNGTLDLGGFSITINGLSGAGVVDNSAPGGPFTLSVGDNNQTSAFGGIMRNTAGTLALNKIGSGTLTMSGYSTYAGATTVTSGILRNGSTAASYQPYQITTNTTTNQGGGFSLGYNFNVNPGKLVIVTQLGFYDSGLDGLANSHVVRISTQGTGAVHFVTATVPAGTAGTLAAGYRFVTLASPIVLAPGNYTIWGDDYSVDGNYNTGGSGPAGPTDAGPGAELTFVGTSSYGAVGAFPTNGDGGPAYRYGAVSFQFVVGGLPFPATTAVTVGSGAAFDLNGVNTTIGSLTGPLGSSVTLGSGNLSVGDATSTDFAGSISGGGGLVKQGAGTLTLSGANSYGATTISAGALRIGNGGSTGTLGSGPVVDNSSLIINRGDAFTLAALVSGSGTLTQAGNGVTTLSNANTYSGDTIISAGTLRLGNAAAIPTGTGKGNVVDNATLDLAGLSPTINGLSGSGVIDTSVAGSLVLTVGNGNATASFAGVIQNTVGAIALTKIGTGTQTLAGANTYSGDTTITAGTLRAGNNAALPSGPGKGNLVVTGVLDLGGFNVTVNGLTGTGTVDNSAPGGPFTFSAGGNNQSSTFAGVIKNTTGTVALTKIGSGTLSLTAANTYSGATTVAAGTLRNGIPSSFQAYQTALSGSNQAYGGSLGYDFTVNAGKTVTVTQLGFWDANFDGLALSHVVKISAFGGGTDFVVATVPAGTVAPLISGYRFVTLASPVTLLPGNYTIYGDAYNTDANYNSGGGFVGPTDSGPGGELSFFGGSRYGSSAGVYPTNGDGGPAYRYGAASFQFTVPPVDVLPVTTALQLTSSGSTFDANSHNTTIGSLAGVAGSIAQMGAGNLTVGDAASTSFAGAITGSGSLTKVGPGTLALGGANTYTGPTAVNQGTLSVNGSLAGGPAATDVAVNNTGTLAGTGTIAGTVHVASGGAVSPGNSVGTLSTGSTDFVAGASFNVEIVGNTFDQLNVSGNVALGSAKLIVDPASTPLTVHAPYIIINNQGGSPVSGIFTKPDGVTPLNQGDQVGTFGGELLFISYTGGDGNDVELFTSSDTINGTPGNDTLVVRQKDAANIELSFNGGSFFPFNAALLFTFNGLGGTDQIVIDLATASTFSGHLMFDGESIRVQGAGMSGTTASFQPNDANKVHAGSGFLNYAGSPTIDFVGVTDAGMVAMSGALTLQNGATTDVAGTLPAGYTTPSLPALRATGPGIDVRFRGNTLSRVATGFGPGDTITVAAAGATADGPLELTGVTIGGSGVLAGTSLDATALAGIMLNTSIASLTAQTFDLAGDIVIVETDAIDLTSVETFGGSVSVSAGGDINVSYVAAFDSSISLQVTGASGSVLDLNSDASADVRAAFGITLVAKGSGTIGTSANPLDLDSYGVGIIDALSGQTDNRDISLTVESGDVRVLKLNAVAGGGLVPAVTSGNVALTTDGNVFMDSDAFGGGADIVANLVTLTATGELGTNANPLELNAVTLATSTISGGLLDSAQFLAEADSVAIGSSGLNPGNASVNLERLGAGAVYTFSSGDSINDAARLNLADGVQVVLSDDETLGALGDYPGHVATAAFADVLFAGRTLTIGANGNDTSYSGTLSGANGQLVKTGVGRFTEIDAGLNTYSGLTTVANGALVLAKTGGGNKAIVGPIMLGDSVGATGSATLEIGANEQIAEAANIQFTGIDGRLLSTAGTTETITTPTDFAGGDVKVAGLLITTNAYDQPTGTTTFNGGVLRVGPAGTLNSSLGTSATPGGTLQGSGTIYTNILTSWGTIDPSSGVTDLDVGNRSPGRITIRGNLQMTASSVTNLDVAPTGSDQLNVGINTALALPAGSYTNLSNYDLDPYLRGDVAAVTEQGRRGVNDLYSINGTVRLNGALNTRPIQGSTLTNNVTYGNSMNFVWRALNLPMGGFWGDLNPKGGNLSSVPSDFTTRNSLDVNGLPTTAMQFDPRFMGSGGQFNAVGQSVGYVVKFMGNDQAGLTAPAYSVGQAKGLTLTSLTSSAAVDTTAVKVTKQLWNAMKDSHTRVTLTITNTSAAAATGPIYVELVGIPAGATVFNAAGKRPSTGKPYLVVPAASLAAGAAVTMEVDLLTPVMLGKTAALTTQVLRGGMP